MILNKKWVVLVAAFASQVLTQTTGSCRRDYSPPCAEGWHKLINKDECVGPISYTGPCHRMLQIEHDSKMKKLQEQNCNISWPCLTECDKDYTSACPESWVNEEGTVCRPLSTYSGSCLYSKDFANMSDAQKEIWSNKCETSWPCKTKCRRDYVKTCPENWKRDDKGLCTAPKNYNGPCLPRASLFSLDQSMKVAFAELCRAPYPCMRNCSVDRTAVCPKKWMPEVDTYHNTVRCLPPVGYRGPCNADTKFAGLGAEAMDEKSAECSVDWPCDEATLRGTDYNQLCPEGWALHEQFCLAPQNYNGPCMRRKQFGSFSRETKIEYEYECNVQWPLHVISGETQRSTGLRKGRSQHGAVEPTTGNVISII